MPSDKSEQEFIKEMYIKYYPLMKFRILNITHNPDIIDDLIHDVFVKIIRNIETFQDSSAQASYLYTAITNVCIDYLRKNSKQKTTAALAELFALDSPTSPSAEDSVVEKELFAELLNAMKKLSTQEYLLLHYRYFMNYSLKEISKYTDIPFSNVSSYLTRAKRNLLKIFKKGES